MQELLYKLIIIFSSAIYLAFIVGIFKYKKLPKHLKLLFYYTTITVIIGSISIALSIQSKNNLFVGNIQAMLEFALLSVSFALALKLKPRSKIALLSFLAAIFLYRIISHYLRTPFEYDNVTIIISSTIIVILSVSFLIKAFMLGLNDNATKIISIGAFMNFSSTFLIGLLDSNSNQLTYIQLHWVYLINAVFFMIFSILIATGFIICGKK